MDEFGNWSAVNYAYDGSGTEVGTNQSPTLAVNHNNGNLYMLRTDPQNDMLILKYYEHDDHWDLSTYAPLSGENKYRPKTKIGMIWQPFDRSDAPYGEGHWWLAYPDPNIPGKIVNMRVDSYGALLGSFGSPWASGEGVSFIDAPEDAFLQAVTQRRELDWANDGSETFTIDDKWVEYEPFAGGIIDVELTANSDWPQLGKGTCRELASLREAEDGAIYCGSPFVVMTSSDLPEDDDINDRGANF